MADSSAPGDSTRRISWGNRLLAPAALIIVVIAIVAIVSANTGDDSNSARDATTQVDGESSGGGGDGPENPKTYTVEEGDTLGAIAEKFSVSTDRLERLNPEMDPQTLNAGQELQIR